jgi:Peptidase family M23
MRGLGLIDGVPAAEGAQSPVWPLPDVTLRRWTFGASRGGGSRRHAGVDLYARRGSVVLAPEAGEIVATQRFNGPNAVALLIQTDTGPVILLGEVEPRSWQQFGLSRGSRVDAGQPVATVGINPGGSQMLHLEMYRDGTRKNHRWYAGQEAPDELLDPTGYLQSAKALDVGQSDDDIEDDDGEAEDPQHQDDPVDDPIDDPVDDDGSTTIPSKTTQVRPRGGMAGLVGLIALLAIAGDDR